VGLYSIQEYVRSLIDGLTFPLAPTVPALTAWVTPPTVEKATGPRAYVWGGRVRGGRQTAPRGPGMKRRPWTVDVYLIYLDTPDDARTNEPFPRIIDAVIDVFETTVMPLWIDQNGVPVGPNAGSTSDTQIQAIGESYDLDYPPERLPHSLRMVWYSARIGLDVLEVKQA
jgi:hypothetical protein